MEFEIDQARFLSSLTLAQTVADRRSTTPILAHVLLRATDDKLVCIATDMMIGITESVPCEVSSPGSLTLSVRHLHNVIRTLPTGALRIKSLDNSWAQILAARSEFKLMGMSEANFPELPDAGGVDFTSVPGHKLIDLIEKTLPSVSTEESRVNLNGALFESNGSIGTMISTDGHRLTKYSLPMAGPTMPTGIIIPRKGMDEIRKVLNRVDGEVEIGVGDHMYLFVRANDLTLSVKLNNVTFPQWDRVVPKNFQRRAAIDREELIGALRRAVVIAPEKTSTVRVQLDKGSIKLYADNPDLGATSLEITADYDGSPLTAGFNANYLIDALTAVNAERIYLDFQGVLDPCVLRPAPGKDGQAPDFLAVVMPMRV